MLFLPNSISVSVCDGWITERCQINESYKYKMMGITKDYSELKISALQWQFLKGAGPTGKELEMEKK